MFWRFFGALIVHGPYIIYCYFKWMRKYSKHPEKYPIEERYATVRALLIKINKTMGIKFYPYNADEFLSENNHKPRYIVCNHMSFYDPLAFIVSCEKPITFIAKKEVLKLPYVGTIVKCLSGEFLDREDLKQNVKVFKSVKEKMDLYPELDWLIFAEGGTNKGDIHHINKFHDGSFKIGMQKKCDIYVFAIYGSRQVFKGKNIDKYCPVLIKQAAHYTPADYENLKTVEISAKSFEYCDNALQDLRPEFHKLKRELNPKKYARKDARQAKREARLAEKEAKKAAKLKQNSEKLEN